MIIDVYKYLFIGAKKDIATFFERAQKEGFIEFISPFEKRAFSLPKNLEQITLAIKTLRKQPPLPAFLITGDENADEIANHVMGLKQTIEKLEDEKRYLNVEINRISPFGDFSIEDIRAIERQTGKRIQFFCMKESLKNHGKIKLPEDLIYIGTEYDMNYYMSISDHVIALPGLIEMHITTSLSDLKHQLALVNDNIKKNGRNLKDLAGYIPFLKEKFLEELDQYDLGRAQKEISFHLDDGMLFAVEAWIPKSRIEDINSLMRGLAIHAEPILIEKKDTAPTCMENKGTGKIGEDLVNIYDTPATSDKDPSKWLLWSFTVFFAIIISDAGYGAIYLLIALFFRFKFYKKAKAVFKRFLDLITILSVSCVIWGIFSGAYFGMKLSPHNPLNEISFINMLSKKKAQYHFEHKDKTYDEWIDQFPSLKQVTNVDEFLKGDIEVKKGITNYAIFESFHNDIFLEISLILGVVHLMLSLIRGLKSNWSGIGWIAFMIGGYLYFPATLDATTFVHYLGIMSKPMSFEVGLQLLLGGFGLAVFLGLIQHKLRGLEEISKAIQIFADALSYLRLYALGLAAMILAATFNELGEKVGLVGGILILVIGHGVNLVIGTMGGVIHGLRLNFIEWYHYSFSGNGRIFKPLKLRSFK